MKGTMDLQCLQQTSSFGPARDEPEQRTKQSDQAMGTVTAGKCERMLILAGLRVKRQTRLCAS
jgi:hypothetical protein